MGGYATNAIEFLIRTVFDLYLLSVMLRFLLQITRANFYNPVSQFLVKVTNPPLIPLRRIIPGVLGVDMAALVLMLAITFVKFVVLLSLSGHKFSMLGLLVLSIADLVDTAIKVFLFTIFVQIILSWLNPASGGMNPMMNLLHTLNEPLLSRARRIIKPIQGFDLSPILPLLGLQLLIFLLVAPLQDLAMSLM